MKLPADPTNLIIGILIAIAIIYAFWQLLKTDLMNRKGGFPATGAWHTIALIMAELSTMDKAALSHITDAQLLSFIDEAITLSGVKLTVDQAKFAHSLFLQACGRHVGVTLFSTEPTFALEASGIRENLKKAGLPL